MKIYQVTYQWLDYNHYIDGGYVEKIKIKYYGSLKNSTFTLFKIVMCVHHLNT
jgi:hypothetical protein